ncbi:MAG TPA: hypothetical protein PLQ12_12515 [Candidatus Defluviicoccus seviourii]|nr:hypothetical protein [Candidatus Defluviicoccus seviourii]
MAQIYHRRRRPAAQKTPVLQASLPHQAFAGFLAAAHARVPHLPGRWVENRTYQRQRSAAGLTSSSCG